MDAVEPAGARVWQPGGGPPALADAATLADGIGAADGVTRADAALPPGDAGSNDGGQPPAGFRFLAWADTKDGLAVLASLSGQAQAFNPDLTIYPGDLVPGGFSTSTANTWKTALNGNGANAMFDITFATRGNHDTGADSTWQSYFNLSARAAHVGATNYASMTDSLTYSFDYGNAHFIGIDVLGDVTLMTTPELTWVDNDLSQAEVRGLTHAFLFWHGPIYPVGGHCCPRTARSSTSSTGTPSCRRPSTGTSTTSPGFTSAPAATPT